MIALGNRPNGPRLIGPTDIKIKGLQIQRQPDEPTVKSMYVNWRWSYLRSQVDLAVDILGANCVKLASSVTAILDGAITRATHHAQMRQFLDYAASKGVLVYLVRVLQHLLWRGRPDSTDGLQPSGP